MSKKACRCSIQSTLPLFLRLLWNFLNKPLRRELQEEKSSKLGAAATCINVSFDLQNYLGKCANNGTNNSHQWELYYLLPLPHPNHHPLSPLQFLQNLPPTPLDTIHCWPHLSIFREYTCNAKIEFKPFPEPDPWLPNLIHHLKPQSYIRSNTFTEHWLRLDTHFLPNTVKSKLGYVISSPKRILIRFLS